MVASAVRDAVAAYAESVIAGEIVAGALVRNACERHLRDLETGQERGLVWDQEAADRAIAFFGYLRQSKGRWADMPLSLLPWQQFVIGSMFGWKRANGLRRFRRSYVEIARKNGKTTLAAGIGLYLLSADSEAGAEVYAAATKRDQARLCWDEASRMVMRTPALHKRIKSTPSRANLHILETSSKFEALGGDSDSLDGLNVHGALIDELHAHRTRDVVDVLETAAGAREQPMFLYITTAGVAGESIYQETHDYAARVVEGAVSDDGWFVYIAKIDDDDDWTNPNVYGKANPSLGETVQIEELIEERDRAMEVPGRQNAFKRLRLNVQTEQVSRWLDVATWDRAYIGWRPELEAYRGRECWAGLDLATTTDTNALVLVFPEDDGSFYTSQMFFVPDEGLRKRADRDRVPYPLWRDDGWLISTEGNITDYDVIREYIRDLADDAGLQIRELAYDRWNANQLITQLVGDGLACVPVGQGYASLSGPSKELEALLLGGKLKHDGNPVMRWMVGNVAVEQDPAGNVKPSKAKSTERIDGVVALVMALSRAIIAEPDSGPALRVWT